MSWASWGTSGHVVKRRRPGRHPDALHLPDGWVHGPVVVVRGMAGRNVWPRITDALDERVVELTEQQVREVISG
jgi:hypothetical protein